MTRSDLTVPFGALPRWLLPALLAAIVLSFGLRNLPWHLDDYDQAKQAYVSWEMVQEGHWWFQHTPTGKIATKPPLAGWISASLATLSDGRAWDLAWRLPPFICSLVLLGLLYRTARAEGGEIGAVLAVAAFGCNVIAQRLATLVRTDMMLCLTIFLLGHLIFVRLRSARPWQTRDRFYLAGILLASLLIKGPIAYAFLLPGLVAFRWLQRRSDRPGQAWCGWWPWLLPLVFFALWAGLGIWLSPDFYHQVVLTEFLGRFQSGEGAPHRSQPPWFYLAHLLYRFFPWSFALLGLACLPEVRAKVRRDPALLWLVCWALGGLLLMSLIPSKRVDRIFPVLPPLCLLLGAAVPLLPSAGRWRADTRAVLALVLAGFLGSGIYLTCMVTHNYRTRQGGLKAFGAGALRLASGRRLAVVNARDEGLLLYFRETHFVRAEEASAAWQQGTIDACVLPEREWEGHSERWPGASPIRKTGVIPDKNGTYVLLVRGSGP